MRCIRPMTQESLACAMNDDSVTGSGQFRLWHVATADFYLKICCGIISLIACLFLPLGCANRSATFPPIATVKIGFVAPLRGEAAVSSEATRRGMEIAVNEINAKGGVLGFPLEIILSDSGLTPSSGELAALQLIAQGAIAIVGGVHDTIIINYLDNLSEQRIPLINVWGAIPEITKSGFDPNVAFCVAATHRQIGEYLSRYPVEVLGALRPSIVAENGHWGDAHVDLLTASFETLGIDDVHVERFGRGVTQLQTQVERIQKFKADSVILVAHPVEGAALVRTIHASGWEVPIVAHPSIHSPDFFTRTGPLTASGLYIMHTKAFMLELTQKQEEMMEAYYHTYQVSHANGIPNLSAVARGYDGIHLLAKALDSAGLASREALLHALENTLSYHRGVLKEYRHPFGRGKRNPFVLEDYVMAQWQNGHLQPADIPRIARP